MSDQKRTLAERFDDRALIDQALRQAARDARRLHKAMGSAMATWKGGKVVWVQPEDIRVDDDGLPSGNAESDGRSDAADPGRQDG